MRRRIRGFFMDVESGSFEAELPANSKAMTNFKHQPYHLEVCVDSLDGCIIATESGATRIEISLRLEVGGITPSIDLVRSCLRATHLPVIALIRSRPGHFIYDPTELELMLKQCEQIANLGVAGLAVGALKPEAILDSQMPFQNSPQQLSPNKTKLDTRFLEEIAHKYSDLELVAHRAFDELSNPEKGIAQLHEMRFDRILTSGGTDAATESLERLKDWHLLKLLEILPAGGVNPCNALKIIQSIGCNQLHGSFRSNIQSRSGLSLNSHHSITSSLPDAQSIRSTAEILSSHFGC